MRPGLFIIPHLYRYRFLDEVLLLLEAEHGREVGYGVVDGVVERIYGLLKVSHPHILTGYYITGDIVIQFVWKTGEKIECIVHIFLLLIY